MISTVVKRRIDRQHKISPLLAVSLFALTISGCWSSGTNPNDANPVSDYEHDFNEPKEDNPTGAYIPNTEAEIELLVEAMRSYDRGMLSRAKDDFAKLEQRYPTSYYAPLAELKTADCLFFLENTLEALPLYEEFLRLRPKHEATPYVQYQIARSYHVQYKGVKNDQAPLKTAITNYNKVIENYASSEYAPLARMQINACREALADHEYLVAKFYLKTEQKKAAANRFAILAADYPDTKSGIRASKHLPEVFAGETKLLKFIQSKDSGLKNAPKGKQLIPTTPAVISAKYGSSTLQTAVLTDGEYQRSMLLSSMALSAQEATKKIESGKPSSDRTPAMPKTLTAIRIPPTNFLHGLSCEQIDQVSIFSARLSSNSQVALTESDLEIGLEINGTEVVEDSSEITVQALIKPTNTDSTSSNTTGQNLPDNYAQRRELSCETQVASLAIRTERNSARLSLSRSSDSKFKFFTLDRPYRVVAVVENR